MSNTKALEFIQIINENKNRYILGSYDMVYSPEFNDALEFVNGYTSTLASLHSQNWDGSLVEIESFYVWFTTAYGARQMVNMESISFKWDGTTLNYSLAGKYGVRSYRITFGDTPD